jgi:hypothetical protein
MMTEDKEYVSSAQYSVCGSPSRMTKGHNVTNTTDKGARKAGGYEIVRCASVCLFSLFLPRIHRPTSCCAALSFSSEGDVPSRALQDMFRTRSPADDTYSCVRRLCAQTLPPLAIHPPFASPPLISSVFSYLSCLYTSHPSSFVP